MKEKSLRLYILRLLKNVNYDIHICSSAMNTIDSMLKLLLNTVINKTILIIKQANKKTITEEELKTSLSIIFPSYIYEMGQSRASLAIATYQLQNNEPKSRQSKAGIIISVSLIEKYIRQFGQNTFNVSFSAPIFLASFIQEFLIQLFTMIIDITEQDKKTTISDRHLFLGIVRDEQIHHMVKQTGIILINGGVEPQNIEQKPKSRLQSKSVKKEHRWRPGTKTVMNIRKLQKTTELIIQSAPFSRIVREIIKKYCDYRVSVEFLTNFQAFIEHELIKMFITANKLCCHTGRETLFDKDIKLYCQLNNIEVINIDLNNSIAEATLRNISLRAGVRRLGECAISYSKSYAVHILNVYIQTIVKCTQYHQNTTITTKNMLEGLSFYNIYPAVSLSVRKNHKQDTNVEQGELEQLEL